MTPKKPLRKMDDCLLLNIRVLPGFEVPGRTFDFIGDRLLDLDAAGARLKLSVRGLRGAIRNDA